MHVWTSAATRHCRSHTLATTWSGDMADDRTGSPLTAASNRHAVQRLADWYELGQPGQDRFKTPAIKWGSSVARVMQGWHS